MRVNARLDDDRAAKLQELQLKTQKGASDLLKLAIDCLYKEQVESARRKVQRILASEFIGCAQGPEDLAQEHGRYLINDLGGKHGIG